MEVKFYIKNQVPDYWMERHFPNKDLLTLDDLLKRIDELDEEVGDLENTLCNLKRLNDYPDEERDREREVLGI